MRYKTAMIAAFAVATAVSGPAMARKKAAAPEFMSLPPAVESEELGMSLPHPMVCDTPPQIKLPKRRFVQPRKAPFPNA